MDRTTVCRTLFISLLICAASGQARKAEQDVDIYSFHINSTVTSRYAITVITSRVANRLNESKEVHFQVKIPKNAFISKFRMTIEGKTYDGVVQKKEEAQQQYSRAVSRGESAGMVSSVGRTLEEFKTSVTVAALSKVTFELTYEELLKRRLGKYELLINAQPMQPVADFKIDIYILESPGISFLEVKGGLNTNELANAVTTTRSGKEAWVNFYPTREQQTKCDVCGVTGLNGDLIIIYDAERPKPIGEVQASHGYFVHYFAPTDIQRISKNVMFIIDRSGSMSGRKIEQTRDALLKILGDVAEDDFFGLITFDSAVEVWKPELLPGTERNLQSAKDFVRHISDRGATNINSAVLKGVDILKRHTRSGSASILILLTDGAPNTGESDPSKIQANVREAIGGRFPLYCLGFGFDVNFDFLSKMALENNGQALRIYEDTDADLQLQGFYKTVAVPLLIDVQMNYPGAANLTQTSFRYYYNGSEIVVAGKITDNSLETFQTEVIAVSKANTVTYQDLVSTKEPEMDLPEHGNSIERLWAYLTVKQLLEREMTLDGQEKEMVKDEVLKLSLKYQFVTPLTSMVVTKPQGEDTQVADKPKEGEKANQRQSVAVPVGSFRRRSKHHRPSGHGGQKSLHSMFPHSVSRPGIRLRSSSRSLSTQSDHADIRAFRHSLNFRSHPMNYGAVSPSRKGSLMSPKLPHPTVVSPDPVMGGRFLISARGQPKPLCYDFPVNSRLCLLTDPSSDFSMNGKLSPKGFKRIVLHYKTNHSLTVSVTDICYHDGLNKVVFVWGTTSTKHEADGISLILRGEEMDVTMGNVRVVLIRHMKDNERFLWPSVLQQPNNTNIHGILGKNNLQYEELPRSMIRIQNKEVKATWSSVTDYRRSSAPVLDCWLVPYQFILQGKLSNFTVPQL